MRLLEIASSYDVEKFVLVSSGGTIYGKTQEVPISEEHQTNPISPYGITKLTTEKYALMFNELNAIPVVCVRPANAYGERQKPFVGQGFVATAIVSILMGQEINLFGKSGTIRDYIHVTDVANGIVAALEHGMPGSCYNIGSGVGRSNNDVLDAIYPFAKMSNLECKTKILPPRSFDVPVNVLCSKKITNDTDWKRVVSFEEGIERTWKWYYRKYYIRT